MEEQEKQVELDKAKVAESENSDAYKVEISSLQDKKAAESDRLVDLGSEASKLKQDQGHLAMEVKKKARARKVRTGLLSIFQVGRTPLECVFLFFSILFFCRSWRTPREPGCACSSPNSLTCIEPSCGCAITSKRAKEAVKIKSGASFFSS